MSYQNTEETFITQALIKSYEQKCCTIWDMDSNIITLFAYLSNGDPYGDFLVSHGYNITQFSFFKRPKKKFDSKIEILVKNLYIACWIIFHQNFIFKNKVYCSGMHFGVLLAYKLLNKRKKEKVHLYLHNFYLHALGEKTIVKKMLKYLMDNNNITIICQSPHEVQYFKTISEALEASFVPYCSSFMPKKEISQGNYVFSGGYTNRDFEIIIKLALLYPNESFVIVASSLKKIYGDIPKNVKIYMDLPLEEFDSLLSQSSLIIVPLKENVGSSGQMLVISAMRNKKPIIYTDVQAINYYFDDNSGFPYKLGDIDSLNKAFIAVKKDTKHAQKVGENAYKRSLEFMPESCHTQIARIMNLDL